jgi:hypothetical protein
MLRESENRMLRIILEPKRCEMVISWKKLHKDQLHNWAGHVARKAERRNAYIEFWWASQKEGDR